MPDDGDPVALERVEERAYEGPLLAARQLVAGYVPRTAERVLEIKPSHGRAEILSAVQFLVDLGL